MANHSDPSQATSASHRLPNLRIGLGYDSHRLGSGGPLRLGGVDLESDWHAIGHSDADVLLHATVDALLGAANQGDIGQLFPNTAEENRGRDSGEFLLEAMRRVRAAGWEVVNLDAVVLAQTPKISPHLSAITQRIADVAGLAPGQVSLKGKTGEGVGPIGRHEAIAARVVCLLYRPA